MKHNITILITLITLILLVLFLYESIYLKWIIVSLLLLFFIVVAVGSSFIQLNYFVESINHGKNKGIAITFDDGPNAEITPKILTILAEENIKATFFVIGDQIEENKAILLQIHNEGHIIGNHSFSHTKKLTLFSTSKLTADIKQCSAQIEKVIYQKPLYFRPPFGVTTPRYKKALKHLGMNSIGWSIRSLDTVSTNKEVLYKKITSSITNGSILLFHDTQQITLDVLPEIIQFCKTNGITIVPLPELINIPAYE